MKQSTAGRQLAAVAIGADGRRVVLPLDVRPDVVGISIIGRLGALGLELIGLIRGFRQEAWR